MKPQITINKLELIVAGTKLELTLDQARELRDILNDAFPLGAPLTPPVWTYPVVVEKWHQPAWPHWLPEFTCGSNQNSGTLCLTGR